MKKKFYILCILVLAGSLSPVIAQIDNNVNDLSLYYAPHGSIDIDADLDFIGYAFPGTGDPGTPYIIENYIISTASTFGINIESVSKYFVIRNCYIENQNDGIRITDVDTGRTRIEETVCINNNDNGIDIVNSGVVTLTNNTCENNVDYGIYVDNCDDSTFANNTIVNNGKGMYIRYSDTLEVTENTCIQNDGEGIYIASSDSSQVIENLCYENKGWGIYVSGTTLNVVQDNIVYDNSQGIRVSSDFAVISNNSVHDNLYPGLYISGDQVTVEDNFCFNNEGGIEIRNAGTSLINNNTIYDNKRFGIEISGSYYSTISFNNLTRNNLEIAENMIGFYLVYTLQNNTVDGLPFGFLTHLVNETVTEEYGQLLLANCTDVTIDSKEVVAIKLFDSPGCTIANCTIQNGGTGIYLRDSEDTEIVNNSLSDNWNENIYVSYSEGVTAQNNTLNNSEGGGISFYYSPNSEIINNSIFGARSCSLSNSPNSDIMNNSIFDAESCSVYSSSSSRILNNTISAKYGVSIGNSINQEIRDNNLLDGGFGFSSARLYIPNNDIGNNLIRGKPLGIYQNIADTTISQPHGQLYLINCDRVVVENQNIDNAPYGIYLAYGDDCIIQNCLINGAIQYGIYVTNSTNTEIISNDVVSSINGMVLLESPYSLITQNTFVDTRFHGIELYYGSDNNQITHNLIQNSTYYGLVVSSSFNVIHHNNFIQNHISHRFGTSQAEDGGTVNQWYDASISEGNYYDDWSGSGAYAIDGGSTDPYPLSSEASIIIPEYSKNMWFCFLMSILSFSIIPLLRYKRR